jgi:glucose/arabinose dehydrogenase
MPEAGNQKGKARFLHGELWRRAVRAAFILSILLLSAAGAMADRGPVLNEVPAPGQQPVRSDQTNAPSPEGPAQYRLETIATGLVRPWSIAFLPEDRLLVTERGGTMRIIQSNGVVSPPLAGLPAIRKGELGGLFDVVLDPRFAQSGRLYFAFLEQRGPLSGLAIARARLDVDRLSLRDVKVIFRARPDLDADTNLGGRLLIGADGMLYATIGDRFQADQAQRLDSDLGKVIRITTDGAIPLDNPFLSRHGARPEIYALGIRNALGIASDAGGRIWTVENGPKGGDELNLIRKGANYGWPVITYGRGYDDKPIGIGTAKPGMVQPVYYWDPSIATGGFTFYDGRLAHTWRGNLLIASLKGQHVARLIMRGGRVVAEEQILGELKARIRDVREGPDGALYVLTDEDHGRLIRVTPSVVSAQFQPAGASPARSRR